jgi:quinol monooxygenase YgiN
MKKTIFTLVALISVVLFAAVSGQAAEKHAAKKEEAKGLSALVVKIHVKGEYREQFMKEMWADAIGSEKKEPGCLMFNITHDKANPNILYLFEVYKDDKAVEAHKKTPHFLKWLETTKGWLAAPLEITPCVTVYPPADSWKKRKAPKM